MTFQDFQMFGIIYILTALTINSFLYDTRIVFWINIIFIVIIAILFQVLDIDKNFSIYVVIGMIVSGFIFLALIFAESARMIYSFTGLRQQTGILNINWSKSNTRQKTLSKT